MEYSLDSIRALVEHSGRRIWCLRRNGLLVSEGEQENEEIFETVMSLLLHHPHGEYNLELRTSKSSNRNLLSYKFYWGENPKKTKVAINGVESAPQKVDYQFVIDELRSEKSRSEKLQMAIENLQTKNRDLEIAVMVDRRVRDAIAGMPQYSPPANWEKFAEIGATAFGNVVGNFVGPNLQKWGMVGAKSALAGNDDADGEEVDDDVVENFVNKHFKGVPVSKLVAAMDVILSGEGGGELKKIIMQMVQPSKKKIGFSDGN